MFKRRPSIFNKSTPSSSSLPSPSAEGGTVKRRTSFFSSSRTSFVSTATINTTGLSTPASSAIATNGDVGIALERSESLPGFQPPELRKRADSETSSRSSLEDLRRQIHDGQDEDHDEGTEGLMGGGVGRRNGDVLGPTATEEGVEEGAQQDDGHEDEQHDSVPALPPPSASRSPLPPSSTSLPTPPESIVNGNGHLPVPASLVTNGSSDSSSLLSPSPSPLPSTTAADSSDPSPSPSSPSHPSHPHHHHQQHSPPLAAPPPLRATTISALTPPPSAVQPPKKKSFMSMGGGKAKKEAAAAAALLAQQEAQRILDEMTPAQKIERAKQAERAHLLQTCMELGVEIYDIAPDGHCLYAAVADQLFILRLIKEEENKPETTRLAASTYMLANPDAFLPFLVGVPADPDEEPEEGEDPNEPLEEDGMMTMKGFHRYCKRVRESGEWGGEPEILALSRYYQIPIHVVQSNHPKIVAHSPDPKANATLEPKAAKKIRAVRISYHRRLYGLGEHYNSLRKIQYTLTAFSAMVPM